MRFSRRRRTLCSVVAVALLAAAAIIAWWMLPPGPLSFTGGQAVDLAAYAGPTPVGVPADFASADLATRGKYLAVAADCQVCHTAKAGRAFAGGLAFSTPFGLIYSPNITPDRETGIGTWSDADFLRAVHRGIAKDGTHLYPAFPYESYALMDDSDVLAIKAYLFSLAPVHATAPPNTLRFPFDQRWLMAIWSAFYNPDHRFRPQPDQSPQWNRGAYLVEALGHCGDCHTPRNLAQAPDNRRKFAGAVIDGWHAYNITSDRASGVGGWSDAQLADYLRTGHADAHGSAGGPMAEVVDASLSHLESADIAAMVAYLRSVPAQVSPNLSAPVVHAASDAPKAMPVAGFDPRGKQIFEGACASCHGWSGVGLLTTYATLTGDRAVNDPSGVNIAEIVLSGARWQAPGDEVFMPAFGAAYTDTEIAAVANYVTARLGGSPSHLTARDIADLRPSPARSSPATHDIGDAVILAARLFLAALFLIFGWRKVRDYSGTVSQMAQDRLPMPVLATAAAIFMELPVAFAVAVGAFTRPAAVLLALYTMGTSLVEHRFWTKRSADQVETIENFFKNLSIIGGFLLLAIAGGGKYSLDALLGIAAP